MAEGPEARQRVKKRKAPSPMFDLLSKYAGRDDRATDLQALSVEILSSRGGQTKARGPHVAR